SPAPAGRAFPKAPATTLRRCPDRSTTWRQAPFLSAAAPTAHSIANENDVQAVSLALELGGDLVERGLCHPPKGRQKPDGSFGPNMPMSRMPLPFRSSKALSA